MIFSKIKGIRDRMSLRGLLNQSGNYQTNIIPNKMTLVISLTDRTKANETQTFGILVEKFALTSDYFNIDTISFTSTVAY